MAKPVEGFMVRHKPTGEFLCAGLDEGSVRGGKIWRTAGHLNSAITNHTKYGARAAGADFIKNPYDYEIIVLRPVGSVPMKDWLEGRAD